MYKNLFSVFICYWHFTESDPSSHSHWTGQFTVKKIRCTKRNDTLENQVLSEFRWVRIKRKSGSILLDNQQQDNRTIAKP